MQSNKIIIKYIIKIIVLTIASVGILTATLSYLAFKLDWDTSHLNILSVFIILISSIIITSISTTDFKNSLLLLSAISNIPLLIFSLLNVVFYEGNWLNLLIKIVIFAFVSILNSWIKTRK